MILFEERRPKPIAIISMTVIAALLVLGLSASRLPFISPSNSYQAYFTDSSGLVPGDTVRIAGVPVGEVTKVKIKGAQVLVDFDVDTDQEVGRDSSAQIKLQTFLGTKFISVVPLGTGRLSDPIPATRTAVPYDLPDALSGLGKTVTAIDTRQLAGALGELTKTLTAASPDVAPLLSNLARVSTTIASRDDQLTMLLKSTKTVSATLSERDDQVVDLMSDASLLFQAITKRRDTIRALLVDVRQASEQLSGLISDNRGQLDPLLDRLHTTVQLLQADLPALDSALTQLGPGARYIANATGNGRWLDLFIDNLGGIIAGGLAVN